MWAQLYSSGDPHICRELGEYTFIIIVTGSRAGDMGNLGLNFDRSRGLCLQIALAGSGDNPPPYRL